MLLWSRHVHAGSEHYWIEMLAWTTRMNCLYLSSCIGDFRCRLIWSAISIRSGLPQVNVLFAVDVYMFGYLLVYHRLKINLLFLDPTRPPPNIRTSGIKVRGQWVTCHKPRLIQPSTSGTLRNNSSSACIALNKVSSAFISLLKPF